MHIKELILTNFKNYSYEEIKFQKGINLLFGVNGSGKTNVLDAIHYLALTKSHFLPQDKLAIKYNEFFFRIEGKFQTSNDAELKTVIKYQQGTKKVEVNDASLLRHADHIGNIGIVFIAPDDLEIIDGLSALRRKYMDTSLSQSDHQYLLHLGTYKKLLEQRNSYLKQTDYPDLTYIHTLNEKMNSPAHYIYDRRKKFIEKIWPIFEKYYLEISMHQEKIALKYQSELDQASFIELQLQHQTNDLRQRNTSRGIHRDDLVFTIHDHDVKYTASQGQKKTFLVALFLSQADYLNQSMHFEPILLLDDVFDKLDQYRMQFLLKSLLTDSERQVILTDTSKSRLSSIINEVTDQPTYFELKNGKLISEGY